VWIAAGTVLSSMSEKVRPGSVSWMILNLSLLRVLLAQFDHHAYSIEKVALAGG